MKAFVRQAAGWLGLSTGTGKAVALAAGLAFSALQPGAASAMPASGSGAAAVLDASRAEPVHWVWVGPHHRRHWHHRAWRHHRHWRHHRWGYPYWRHHHRWHRYGYHHGWRHHRWHHRHYGW